MAALFDKLYKKIGGRRLLFVLFAKAKNWIVGAVLIYALFTGALWLGQRHMIYFPSEQLFVPSEWGIGKASPLVSVTNDRLRLNSWLIFPEKSRKKTVLVFFQGNAGHAGHRIGKIKRWTDEGYGVVLAGYRGYGNVGSPSEEGLYADARSIIDVLMAKGIPANSMVLYGESLGTGVATQMALEFDVAGVILESPYSSMVDVAAHHYPWLPVRWLLKDRYDSISKLPHVRKPLLIMHGDRDIVVPLKQGMAMFGAANDPKRFRQFPAAGHNDLYDFGAGSEVAEFLEWF